MRTFSLNERRWTLERRQRGPRSNPRPQLGGTVHIFVAMTMTQMPARDAVQGVIPPGWRIEVVLGVAEPTLVQRRRQKPGSVEELSSGVALKDKVV